MERKKLKDILQEMDVPQSVRDAFKVLREDNDIVDLVKKTVEQEVEKLIGGVPFETIIENLKQAKGDMGEKGDTGERGEKGDSIIGEKGDQGEPGRNGVDGRDGKDGKDGRDGKNGKDGSSDTAIQIRDKLSSLKGSERLDFSAINSFSLPISLSSKMKHGGGLTPYYYDISSSLDGVTKTFTIPSNQGVILITSSSEPFTFRPITDFTTSGIENVTLTFAAGIDAPSMLASGQSIIVMYKK